jgi:putative transposase
VKQSVKDACNAYKTFFKNKKGFPKFKSKKRSKSSFYNDCFAIKFTDTHVQLQKLGRVRLCEHGRIPTDLTSYSNPRISFDGLHWWVSVGVDVPNVTLECEQSEPIGIDFGIKDFMIVSDGQKFSNINKSQSVKRATKRLKRLQRRASRQYLMIRNSHKQKSKNLLKLERCINKTYQRIGNIRTNYIHQSTTSLVKTKPAYIVIEDLNVNGMMQNHCLARAVQEQLFRETRRQFTYKCEYYSTRLIIADRFYPSSKRCSRCGAIKSDLKLSDRIYHCEHCGMTKDRDLNAAINLREYPFVSGKLKPVESHINVSSLGENGLFETGIKLTC